MPIHVCAKCKKIIISGKEVSFGVKLYHKDCFVCSYCGQKITSTASTYKGELYHTVCSPVSGQRICAYCRKPITGRWYILNKKNYHYECYHQYIEKKCSICGLPIHDSYYHDKWGNCAHVLHNGRKTVFCFTCGRIISTKAKSLGGDAVLCNVCASTSITTDAEVERCRRKVLSVFKSLGVSGIPETIPIKLVPREKMEGNLGCIYMIKARDPNLANFRIHITCGLPDLHFRGVLAHEMLHSWLTLYGREVTKDECEGFCNLGEAFIYANEKTPLANYLLEKMYENADVIYGDGYRLQKERYERMGWEGLLDSLRYK